MVNPRYQTPQGQSVAKPGTLLQNILDGNLNMTYDVIVSAYVFPLCIICIYTCSPHTFCDICSNNAFKLYEQFRAICL